MTLKTKEWALLCLVLQLPACGVDFVKSPVPDSSEAQLEQVNYSPFHSFLWVSEDQGQRFYTAMLKVVLELDAEGKTRVSPVQKEFDSESLVSFGCDPGVVAVPEHVAFRKKAEIYLRQGSVPLQKGSQVTIGNSSKNISRAVFHSGGCSTLSTPSDPFLAPYLADGETVSISQFGPGKGVELKWRVPPFFFPFVLVRYSEGEMIPTPMRADLILLDLEKKRLELTYRSTFPIKPQVRKIEFRVIQAGNPPWAGETLEQAKIRIEKEVRYLRACPLPQEPIEACSLPTTVPEPAFFRR